MNLKHEHTLNDLVKDSLLARDDDIERVLGRLEALGFRLDPSVPVQHVENTVGFVSEQLGQGMLVCWRRLIVHVCRSS